MFAIGKRPTSKQMNTIINTRELFLAPAFTCNTTNYANFTAGTLQFEKIMSAPESDIRVWIFASAFLDLLPARNIILGVNVAGVDYDVSYFRFNRQLVHNAWGRAKRFTGVEALPSGNLTFQLRAKLDGAGSVQFQANASGGQITMVVQEILL